MHANQSDDDHSGPHRSEPPSKAELNRAASKLRVYEWERLAYTDAANMPASGTRASFGLFTRLKALVRAFISRRSGQ
ncbi:MAG TPA: hypothetical protein VKV04_03380 [Verrucomicrobiae bacterium]|nr:hypothetical protein [Verrucomicrobiae bacterium]